MPAIAGIPPELLIFGAVMLLMLALAPVVTRLASPAGKIRKQAAKMDARIKKAARASTEEPKDTQQGSLRKQQGDTSLPLISKMLGRLKSSKTLRDRLARSGLNVTAERYMVYSVMLLLLVTVFLHFALGKGALLSFLIGIIVGIGLPHLFVGFKISRQTRKFLQLFPDAIDLIVRGLKAGLPVTESMKMVSKEIEAPVGTIFATIAEKMALGIPLEKTLYDTAAKYRITEFDFFVTSIVLQRETGGNLSEILDNLSEALRQRLMMRMKIKAMSSEANASMYIIGALPVIVMLALHFLSPEYLVPLFDDYRGNIALAIAAGMLGSGVGIMLKMTKFEI